MIRVLDGPAVGAALALQRAPLFLRVTIDAGAGRTDALDQLDDEPEPQETIHVYRRVGEAGRVHIYNRGRGAVCGWFAMADYRHMADIDGELVRETGAWRAWTRAQVDPGAFPLVWRWRTVKDPSRPFETSHAAWGKPRRIASPLAARVGQRCRELARGGNGSRLLEFQDGFRVVAPFYSVVRV